MRFIAFLLTSISKICLRGAVSYPPPPYPPPLCASMAKESKGKKWKERKGDSEILVLERGREKER